MRKTRAKTWGAIVAVTLFGLTCITCSAVPTQNRDNAFERATFTLGQPAPALRVPPSSLTANAPRNLHTGLARESREALLAAAASPARAPLTAAGHLPENRPYLRTVAAFSGGRPGNPDGADDPEPRRAFERPVR